MKYPVDMTVNGRAYRLEVEARTLLVHALRETLGLTGTHVGCDSSTCGACTVLCDGKALKSCTRLAVQADGAEILTIEGLAAEAHAMGIDGAHGLHPLQEALASTRALACGFCAAGMLLVARELLACTPSAGTAELRLALEGNACCCADRERIVEAVVEAATHLELEPSVEGTA
jgi:carbon-monoxide dehydrogenase small subunit